MIEANPVLAEHFDDLEQQRGTAELGIWIFLATEVLFFGGLFLAYSIYRVQYEHNFAEASHQLNLRLGTLNTAILLTSSLTMALAVQFAATARRRLLLGMLAATTVLGLVFLGIKLTEWHEEYAAGLVPFMTDDFHYSSGRATPPGELFFNLYFLMTGLHAAAHDHRDWAAHNVLLLGTTRIAGGSPLHTRSRLGTLLALRRRRVGVSLYSAIPYWSEHVMHRPATPIFVIIWGALLLLLWLTFSLGKIDAGRWNFPIAVSITCIKQRSSCCSSWKCVTASG